MLTELEKRIDLNTDYSNKKILLIFFLIRNERFNS